MDAAAVEYVVARRVLATLGGRRLMLKAAIDEVRAALAFSVLFPTHSPRQGVEVAINLHQTLSGGHYRLTEESFNSSLAHKKCPD